MVGPALLSAVVIAASLLAAGAVGLTARRMRRWEKDVHSDADARIGVAVADAERANQARAEFLAAMNHELRTPINGILGNVELLLGAAPAPAQVASLQSIRESGVLLVQVVSDILDFSTVSADRLGLELGPVDLSVLLTGVDALVRSMAEAKGLRFRTDVGPGVVLGVTADGPRLSQILLNLLGNAIKFTRQGEISVRVEVARGQAGSTVEQRLRFLVADTGPGVAMEARERIFDAFSQADLSLARRFGGTGLGLTIARQLARRMGGELSLESPPEGGARFALELTLPLVTLPVLAPPVAVRPLGLAPDPAPRPKAARVVEGPRTQRPFVSSPNVLVVEDNVVNQRVALRMLEQLGCRTRLVGDGRAAVVAAETLSWDLILMDVQLPEMDGLEATRSIRALELLVPGASPRVPIVGLTAHGAARASCLSAGMDDWLAKPYTPEQLRAAILRWAPQADEPREAVGL